MNKSDLRRFEKALLEEKKRLLRQASITAEIGKESGPDATGDLSGHRTHIADQGTENYERERAYMLKSVEAKALREIDEALKRIANGSYGICESCGRPIARARLEVVPQARLCMKCLAGRSGRQ